MLRSPVDVAARALAVSLALSLGACAPPDLCGEVPATATPVRPRVDNGLRHVAHAHNDYEHERPLADALAAGFTSVEADVWWRDDDIQVSHDAWGSAGTLAALYLAPLVAAVADNGGSVHGDGAPFTLWLDLKDGTAELRDAVRDALVAANARADPAFSSFDDVGVVDVRAVTVIVTGDAASKTALVDDTPAPRPFARDDNALAKDSELDGTVVAAALNFGAYLGGWDGSGSAPDDVRARAVCVVDKAHRVNRKVRFFSGPDTEAAWQLQLDVGVDFINTDDLTGLSSFLAP